MNINIKGLVCFFAKKITYKDGGETKTRTICTTTIERLFKEGERVTRRTIDVEFTNKNFGEDKLSKLKEDVCYQIDVEEGWLTLTRFKDKNSNEWRYNTAIHIHVGKMVKATKVDKEKKEKALKEAEARKKVNNAPEEKDPLEISEDTEELPFI